MKKRTKSSKHKFPKSGRSTRPKEIRDYDLNDISTMIDPERSLKFEDLGLALPEVPPTQVVSIRLPSRLLNQIRAIGSQRDIPYQALIKLFLANSVEQFKKQQK